MRRLFAIVIILQLFTNQEAFAELTKLPFLFHHYNETADEQNFLNFLNEHYSNSNHDSDHEHGKLPFKHSDDGCTHHSVSTTLKDSKTESSLLFLPIGFEIGSYALTNESNFPTYFNNIWQPPKLS